MSQFDFDDGNDPYSDNFGAVGNKKNNLTKSAPRLTKEDKEFDELDNLDDYSDNKPKVFNPGQFSNIKPKAEMQKGSKVFTPGNNLNSQSTSEESNHFQSQNEFTNQRVIFNPSIHKTPEDELDGMVNMNENPRQKFDPNKVYDPNEEPPLLEELGICPDRIKEKVMSVLTLNRLNKKILDDSDMTGPFLIFILFCFSLILQKKAHFGYIYGTTLFGGFLICTLMNLMSKKENILLYNTISVLGYCMIPVVIASFIGLLIDLKAIVGIVLCLGSIILSSYTASNFFEEVLAMQSQKYLIFYPLMLFYTSFLLITLY